MAARILYRPHRDRGMALFFIIALCLGLTAVVLLFAHSMRFEYQGAGIATAARQAGHAIDGAQRYITFILENNETPGYTPSLDSYTAEAIGIGEATCWILGDDPNGADLNTPYYALVDEASKLNLNTATLDMLEALPDMTAELAAAIVDWRDEDDELTAGGAESTNYLLLDPAYTCKNAPYESIEELRMVLGAERAILIGEDENRNHILDSAEDDGDTYFPDDNRNGQLEAGLFEYVTVYSAEPNTDSEGELKININNAEENALQQALSESLGEEAEHMMQALRSGAQYQSLLELYFAAGLSPESFSAIEETLTVSDEERIQGRINVNTACETVLACIPGIGTTYAAQLVALRQEKTEEELQSLIWVTEVLDESAATEAGPYITTHAYQFTADIVALGRHGRGFQREAFVLDSTGDEVVVIARKNLRRYGWPLGSETLAAVQEGEPYVW